MNSSFFWRCLYEINTGWILSIVFGLFLLLVLTGLRMMGGPGMMGGYGYMHPFGWGGMLLGWLIPVGVIVLLVVGAVALVNSLNRSMNPTQPLAVPLRTCSNCGKPAQADWNTCLIVVKSYPEVNTMCGGHSFHTLTPLLTTLTQTANQPIGPVVAARQINCPTCGSAVSPEFAWCPKCGAALKAHPCAYCGQTVSPGDKTCNFCGAPAGSD
jgi:hypothetical protein